MQLPVRPVGGSGKKRLGSLLPAPIRKFAGSVTRPLPRPVQVGLLWLAPVLLVLAAFIALLNISGGVTLRALEQHQYDADTLPSPAQDRTYASSKLIGQSFRAPRDGIDRIDIALATTPNYDVAGEIRLMAGDGLTGTVLYSAPLTAARFENNPFISIDVPGLSGNSPYTLVLETPGGPLTEALTVRYSTFDVLSSGTIYTDKGAADGDLVISLYYKYGLTNLLSDIAGTLSDIAGTLSIGIFGVMAWLLFLFLPGLALLSWLASGLNWGQRVLAAPALTILALPVLLLVLKSVGLPLGTLGVWLIVLISGAAFAWALYRNISASRTAGTQSGSPVSKVKLRDRLRLLPIDLLFWGLLLLIFGLTLAVRFMSLRDATAGLGVDAYHHTLIARMVIDSGGVPQDYLPYAQLSSFTYHFGFHSLVAGIAWLTGQTSPEDLLLLMPHVGQFATALPVLTLTLFGWRAFNNRWAGLIAGAFAGLASFFPAFYVNWSRYTQGLGLALLPAAWVLTLNIFHFPDIGYRLGKNKPPAAPAGNTSAGVPPDAKLDTRNLQSAIDRSGPYILGVVGIAGLFLTHYRIAMIYAVTFVLYVGVRLMLGLTTRRGKPGTTGELSPAVILRRSAALGILTLAALSPWLINLSQNFHSHLVGRESADNRAYYDIGDIVALLGQPTTWAMLVLSVIALSVALKQRAWSLILVVGSWLLVGFWSSPYFIPGLRLPFSGYLDINTWLQSIWLPLSILSGYAVEWLARLVLQSGNSLSGVTARFWRTGLRSAGAAALVLLALALAMPTGARLDGKPYFAPADREALLWMHDNLPPNARVLSNPFAFTWAPTNVYGSDAGMWIPLVSGLSTTVPPLPAYNESLANPAYLDDIIKIIQYEPFNDEMTNEKWQSLKDNGITHIYAGSRSGALNVPLMLASDHTQLVFHKDAVYVFAIR